MLTEEKRFGKMRAAGIVLCAFVLAVQHGKEGDRIEKQNSGIEKEP